MTVPTKAKRPGGNRSVRKNHRSTGKSSVPHMNHNTGSGSTFLAVMDGRTFVGFQWFASAEDARRHLLHGGLA
ncbi:hypothetical protein AncyloWKF20_09475 [Ancylobacter sp. WKF20]|uniref:hypothetical protein n=1 Tax=Ancylobacter sp. WKF20 TaxID=3039801 RepID=UPI00243412A2|nr:hypothetical protein [Ancylobacter sp. WKF20]WGD32022.1 hypothetical protein AncyloWKF20_09475 [Ancylobacter sp. WKF20]